MTDTAFLISRFVTVQFIWHFSICYISVFVWIGFSSLYCITILERRSGDSAPYDQDWTFRGLSVPGFHDYHSLNKWKSLSHSTTEPRSGRADRMEMWVEWAAKTTSLWLWLQGNEEETRTALSQIELNMEASAQRCQIGCEQKGVLLLFRQIFQYRSCKDDLKQW